LNLGGRLYSVGEHSYQRMSGERRAAMLINGESVVKIDVSASGLSVYAGLMGHKALDDIDLYSIDGVPRAAVKQYTTSSFGLGKLPKKWPADTQDEVKVFRKVVKHYILNIQGVLLI